MAVPPWTRHLLNPETVRQLQAKATDLLGDLPVTAARSLDRVMRETRRGADQVRHWARQQMSLSSDCINGSGTFFHPAVIGSPLTGAQLDALVPGEGAFVAAGGASQRRITARLRAATGGMLGKDVLVARSFTAAVAAASAAVGPGSVIVLPRGAACRLDHGPPLPDLLHGTGTRVLEIGAADRCESRDWEAAGHSASAPWYACQVRWPAAHAKALPPGAFADPPATDAVRRIQIVPYGVFHAVPHLSDKAFTLLTRDASEGAWLTIVPGDRLLGGPQSGLILGSEDALGTVQSTPLWQALRAESGTLASLVVTVESHGSNEQGPLALPSLLETSVDNLQNRCERLATQLAAEDSVAACQITTAAARISDDIRVEIPSRQLRITAASGSGKQWVERLASHSPSILVGCDGDAILLDLRWIPVDADSHLVSWISGPAATAPATDSAADGV